MLTGNRDDLAALVRKLRNHGAEVAEEDRQDSRRPYRLPEFDLLGFNYRMTDLLAAVGLVQLGKLDGFIAERQHWAGYYRRELADLTWLRTPEIPADGQHAWQAFVCYVDETRAPASRDEILERLHAQRIGARPGTHAVHMLGFYQRRFGFRPGDFPTARRCAEQTLAIPLHNSMSPDDYACVVEALREIER